MDGEREEERERGEGQMNHQEHRMANQVERGVMEHITSTLVETPSLLVRQRQCSA